nr:uncharacterized protein LOC107444244 [Parasteatoda tepidariorum]
MGMFKDPGELIRIMIFMPQGEVAYEVLLLRKNGSEISCGIQTDSITRLGWAYHVCPCRNNRDAIGVKIKSLSSKPLQICEIKAFVLTSPICVDPHLYIEYGRLQLTRKTATLFCDSGHTPSAASRVECVRDGIWNIKSLYCLENQWDAREPGSLIEKERKSFHNDP